MKFIKPKNLFLVDGIGAFISALSLGVLLVQFEEYVGMPSIVLYILASLAIILAFNSIGSYFLVKAKHGKFLTIIALSNFTYCIITLSLVIFYYEKLSSIGLVYFFSEIVIIMVLVYLELKVVKLKVS